LLYGLGKPVKKLKHEAGLEADCHIANRVSGSNAVSRQFEPKDSISRSKELRIESAGRNLLWWKTRKGRMLPSDLIHQRIIINLNQIAVVTFRAKSKLQRCQSAYLRFKCLTASTNDD